MISFNKSYLFAVAAGAALLSSCSKEMDFSDPNANIKAYEKNWGDKFGDIDPDQNWNMAIRTTLNINLPYIKGEGVMRVYTSNPLEKSSCLMAETKVNNGTGSIVFDAMKDMQQVFVSVEAGGEYRVYGYYGIENGAVNIGAGSASMAKSAVMTRGVCNVTKGEVKDVMEVYNPAITHTEQQTVTTPEQFSIYRNDWGMDPNKEECWFNSEHELALAIIAYFEQQGWNWDVSWFGSKDADGKYHVNGCVKRGGTETKDVVVVDKEAETIDINITYLNGVEKAAANPWKISWGYENFGPGAFFEELKKYYLAPKYGTFYSTPEEMAVVEQGFSITTEGGEIELPFIYGATQNSNMLGYVYYKDGQDPLAQPHYILMNDGRPTENIYFNSWRGDKLNDGMQLSNWNTYAPEEKSIYGHKGSDLVYGTNYKLTFFGENHDMATGTYNFPAGYHVVFFICPQNYANNLNNYNYSLPVLNHRIKHYYYNGPGYETYQEDQTRGAVKAVSWTYKGHRFLGFEDGGADEDLNDIVFWVDGAYTPDQDEEIEVPTEDPEPDPEAQSWVIACEDLGDAGDIDFNDVVFSVSHVSGTNTATITPLAAGGELPSTVRYNGQPVADNAEIHHLLQPNVSAGDNGHYPLLWNVPAGDPLTIVVDENFSMTNHKFSITAEGNGDSRSITMGNETGKAPMMLCLPGAWAWPKEHTQIYEAYPMFRSWVQNSNDNEWYKNFVEDKVVK